MIFERYSGSDKSGDIPKRYARFLYAMEGLSREQRLSFYDELLNEEKDSNWRGFWKYGRAVQHLLDPEQKADLVAGLEEALVEFDLLAANFPHVENEYARALFVLIGEHYIESEDTKTLFEYALRLLPHVEGMRPDAEERCDVYSLIGDALLAMARKQESRLLYRAAVDFHVTAHHAQPEEPGPLASLVYAYCGAGDYDRAQVVYGMFKDLGVPFEDEEQLHAFWREAFA